MKNSTNEDYLLIQETLEGNKDAFGKLIDKYKNLVFNISLKMLGNPTDAEDAAQEVFIQSYEHLRNLKVNEKFYSWIYSITINICKNKLKKRTRTETVELDETTENYEQLQHHEDTETEIFRKYEENKMINKIIELLPVKYRIPFILRYLENRSYEEISKITKLPLGTVKTYLHRALCIIVTKKDKI